MIQVYIFLSLGLIFLISGIVIGKIGSAKGKVGMLAFGFLISFIGFISGFFGYENYMMLPVNYSITNYREVENGYLLTLSSGVKGFTNGKIVISESEARTLKLVELNEKDQLIWVGGTITESRKWISNHRES